MEDRDKDKKHKYVPTPEKGKTVKNQVISLDQIKSLFIGEGLDAQEIAERTKIPLATIGGLVKEHKLPELRSAYIQMGINKIQNKQIDQAQKLMDLEANFKKLRIVQIEKQLEDFLAYYARHGHLYKLHRVTGEVLLDTNSMPMLISIPNISKELKELKEGVSLSEGLKSVLHQVSDLIHTKIPTEVKMHKVVDVDYVDLIHGDELDDEDN